MYEPEMNDDYWTYDDINDEILCFEFTFAGYDVDCLDNGNCFKTKEEAEEYATKVKESK